MTTPHRCPGISGIALLALLQLLGGLLVALPVVAQAGPPPFSIPMKVSVPEKPSGSRIAIAMRDNSLVVIHVAGNEAGFARLTGDRLAGAVPIKYNLVDLWAGALGDPVLITTESSESTIGSWRYSYRAKYRTEGGSIMVLDSYSGGGDHGRYSTYEYKRYGETVTPEGIGFLYWTRSSDSYSASESISFDPVPRIDGNPGPFIQWMGYKQVIHPMAHGIRDTPAAALEVTREAFPVGELYSWNRFMVLAYNDAIDTSPLRAIAVGQHGPDRYALYSSPTELLPWESAQSRFLSSIASSSTGSSILAWRSADDTAQFLFRGSIVWRTPSGAWGIQWHSNPWLDRSSLDRPRLVWIRTRTDGIQEIVYAWYENFEWRDQVVHAAAQGEAILHASVCRLNGDGAAVLWRSNRNGVSEVYVSLADGAQGQEGLMLE